LTAELALGCTIACIPDRARVDDVVIGGEGATGAERLAGLSSGARVGTSSTRRRALVAETRPDLQIVDFRGNLDTRLRRVEDGIVDVAIVAAAGVERLLDVGSATGASLDPDSWVPAPGQGALAVEVLDEREDVIALLEPLTDVVSAAEVECERAFAATLEGGCSVPMGCLARTHAERIDVVAFVGAPDGSCSVRERTMGSRRDAATLGRELAQAILASGGDEILRRLRAEALTEPAAP
jgi:hydroxymethylbilane synthase